MKKGEEYEYNCFINHWDCMDFQCTNYLLCEAWEKKRDRETEVSR